MLRYCVANIGIKVVGRNWYNVLGSAYVLNFAELQAEFKIYGFVSKLASARIKFCGRTRNFVFRENKYVYGNQVTYISIVQC